VEALACVTDDEQTEIREEHALGPLICSFRCKLENVT